MNFNRDLRWTPQGKNNRYLTAFRTKGEGGGGEKAPTGFREVIGEHFRQYTCERVNDFWQITPNTCNRNECVLRISERNIFRCRG